MVDNSIEFVTCRSPSYTPYIIAQAFVHYHVIITKLSIDAFGGIVTEL